ncbi:AAA family ATPase [Nostoc parmelioides]|uniref:ParA family protein n=1 Tax=Nostoc parmelioides FACHB-3921 TaxID=2692909 RepID=A0ABR8BP49_9NOSO|nr:ParA family protein [Nostoc parmelioides FACHB-3921]
MTKVISIFNQAGGVAKTTTAQNLGYQLSLHSHRVLLVDIDPQASLTTFMGLEPADLDKTIYDALVAEDDQPMPIHRDVNGMDLLPANILLANAEQELIFTELREFRLQEVLAPLLDSYDFILIDCPPSLGILSQISLVASTHVLVPIQCQFKALKGTDSLLKTVARVQRKLNRSLKIAGFLPTMYSANNSLDQRTLESIREQLTAIGTVFPPLPRATAMAEAAEYGKPLALCPGKNSAILHLFDEIANAMEKM